MQQFTWDLHGLTIREALEVAQAKIEWLKQGDGGERLATCMFPFQVDSDVQTASVARAALVVMLPVCLDQAELKHRFSLDWYGSTPDLYPDWSSRTVTKEPSMLNSDTVEDNYTANHRSGM